MRRGRLQQRPPGSPREDRDSKFTWTEREFLDLSGWWALCSASVGCQMAEWLGSRAINQNVAGSIPGRAKLSCVPGQGTSPYFPRGNVPVVTVSRSG